ncbi:hypothetical protein [uncultured Metabacillus sp.]|uniref:hypothetical protein n=1 Tax=uncultured Metabacillus sp. TaxID=2860135 RepID=UPI00260EDA09|nr:hypothetical protein [uncultured Metabacillus sp.]
MRNEVYGEAKLDISVPVESYNDLGILEANYKLDVDRIVFAELRVTDINGAIHNVRVHNIETDLHRFFDE